MAVSWRDHTVAVGWIRRQAIHQIEATKPTLARTFPGEVFIWTGVIAVRGGILAHGGLLARNRPTCCLSAGFQPK
ncbi:hypothetical protein [Methylicorpusculum sp.]|uniref:hypothetical protein n=1 Tax=Methylicorpusculum sp. TaxID=2713644 RepID=UPI00272FC019|nr:hypothetical protein [Methylicorpusculum sp.]MDP3528646.1 hypothetical protein [Methylicorpusculum sp.]